MANVDLLGTVTAFLPPNAQNNTKTSTQKTKENARPRFFSIFEQKTQETAEETLLSFSPETEKDLLDEIHSAGDNLRNRPFPQEIKRYKQAVRNFLSYVVHQGFDTERHISGVNLMKRKRFTLVQIVDQKLERLAAGILAGQTHQLEILARLEEIKGLLVDLLQ
ncbi:MAG: DUF327 family protein [Spirochaetaceae bacterium]|jgi:uncharacterized protein YaaR (DUF327 family)|nr:DUF327 family protein [Spirochaetaceae bacterium]